MSVRNAISGLLPSSDDHRLEPIRQPYHWPRGPEIRDPFMVRVRQAVALIVVVMAIGLGVALYYMWHYGP
jgi:hypothetical protein